jgi:predicted  nucleic acid-binding Zn-ribbon protein
LKEVLERLVALQKIDQKLRELESLRGDLPHQVEILKQDVSKANSELQNQKDQFVGFHKEKDALELEIEELESRLKKYQEQLYQVKNNREYDAVSMEIENVKEQISNKQTRVIELITLEGEMEKTIEESKESVAGVQKRLGEKESDLKKRLGETEKEEKALNSERSKITEKLPPRIVSSYQRIFNAKNGLAVVPVMRHGLCSGCYKNLPPQRVLEIREMKRINLCEVCGRILIWDEDAAEKQV